MLYTLGLGSLMLSVGIPLVWLARRWERSTIRRGSIVAGLAVTSLGILAIGLYAWALTATNTSQLARTIAWGASAFGDQDRFPWRSMAPSEDPLVFHTVSDSPVDRFADVGSAASLEEFLESADTTAFIVIHDEVLLYEAYFNGSSREAMQTSFSVAKSFIATLVGIAIDEGYIGDLSEPVTEYVPELASLDDRFGGISLHNLITMSSGLSFDDGGGPWDDPANTYHGTDLRTALLTELRVERPPGQVFHYNDWNVILLGLVLERATGLSVSEYMQSRLWQPMGAEGEGSWSLDSEGHGFEKMFVGVNGRAIDFAKLGRLYLHEGRNGERQVVSSAFVAEATAADSQTDPSAEYQYLWWIDEPRSSYFANGDHGQFIYVDPAAELVIVRHGHSGGDVDWIRFLGELADWLTSQLPTV